MLYLRKDGVGRKLYRTVEREARGSGLGRVFTEAGITARPFVESHGFRVVRKQTVTVQGVPMTNFAMAKTLPPPDGEGEEDFL
jgi:putative acetyltransferase